SLKTCLSAAIDEGDSLIRRAQTKSRKTNQFDLMLMNRLALLTAPAWIGTRPPGGVEVLGLAVVLAQEDRLQRVRKIPLSGLHLHIIFGVWACPLPLAGHILQPKAVGPRLLARVLPFSSLAQPFAGHGTGLLSLADIP